MAIEIEQTQRTEPVAWTEVDRIIDSLQTERVEVARPRQIRNFLLSHQHVAIALLSLVEQLRRDLGADTEMLLEVDISPGVASENLVLNLRRPTYDAHFLDVTRQASLAVLQLAPQDPRFLVTSDFVTSA